MKAKRRELHFENFSDALTECRRLLESGYVRNGNWTLGQMCRHIRMTVDASIDGYPWWMALAMPLRPVLGWLVLPKLLRGQSPSGIKTAGIFVPPVGVEDGDEVSRFEDCVARFNNHTGHFYPHPGFGKMDREKLEHFHAAHLAHHLSFLGESLLFGVFPARCVIVERRQISLDLKVSRWGERWQFEACVGC